MCGFKRCLHQQKTNPNAKPTNGQATIMDSKIKTRILIIPDTHGMDYRFEDKPLHQADVAIHCGDLTDGSKLEEFRTTIQLLRDINAPLKIAIAGNHDLTMDTSHFAKKVAEATPALDPELVVKEYGTPGEARKMMEDAGIVLLEEGTHRFTLENGAKLTVYASPFTPSLGDWAFQYHPNHCHEFKIEEGTDVAITHGPPKGIMDYTHGRERAGCPHLFEAVAGAKPLIHCFGHIHEGWGAKFVTWKEEYGQQPTHFAAIDNDRSHVIEKLSSLRPSKFDTEDEIQEKRRRMERYKQERCCLSSHSLGEEYYIEPGRQTLFVNASVSDESGLPIQIPWLVDVDLRRAS